MDGYGNERRQRRSFNGRGGGGGGGDGGRNSKHFNSPRLTLVMADVNRLVAQTICKNLGSRVQVQWMKHMKMSIKGKVEERVLVASDLRIYFANVKQNNIKTDLSFNFLDIDCISSPTSNEVVFKMSKKDKNSLTVYFVNVDEIISHVYGSLVGAFPEKDPLTFVQFDLTPASRLEQIKEMFPIESKGSNVCGNYTTMYAMWADHLGHLNRDDICWDVDNIYAVNNTREFNLEDFDDMDKPEVISIVRALDHNLWFTKLVAHHIPLTNEGVSAVVRLAGKSTVLEEFTLSESNATKAHFELLADCLKNNPNCSIHSLEDTGAMALASTLGNMKQGFSSLDFSSGGIGTKGAIALGRDLRKNTSFFNSLTRLNLSNNPSFGSEGLTSVADFLAMPNVVSDLNLSNTCTNVDFIFGALLRGCGPNFVFLNISGNKFTTKKPKEYIPPLSIEKFMQSAQSLKIINLSNTKIPPYALKQLLQGIITNPYLADMSLNIRNNELGSSGAEVLASMLSKIKSIIELDIGDNNFEDEDVTTLAGGLINNSMLKHISFDNNFRNRTKNRHRAIDAIIELILYEYSSIESLSFADSKLKNDLIPIIDSVGTNENITSLDVSGNHMGDKGATALAKALQINRKLTHILWDDNATTYVGFNHIAIALTRNHTLTQMPMPYVDIANCMKSVTGMKAAGEKTMNCLKRIQDGLHRNQSPRALLASNNRHMFNHGFINSAQSDQIDRLVMLLKRERDSAEGYQETEDDDYSAEQVQQLLISAEKYKELLAYLHALEEGLQVAHTEELLDELRQHSNDVSLYLNDSFEKSVGKILAAIVDQCFFIDQHSLDQLKVMMSVGCERVSSDNVDDVIVNVAGSELANQISESNISIVSVAANFIFERLETELEEALTEYRRRASVARKQRMTEEECKAEAEAAAAALAASSKHKKVTEEEKKVRARVTRKLSASEVAIHTTELSSHVSQDSLDDLSGGRKRSLVPTGFDDAPVTHLLEQPNKVRATGAKRRRPPTRKPRQTVKIDEEDEVPTSYTSSTATAPAVEEKVEPKKKAGFNLFKKKDHVDKKHSVSATTDSHRQSSPEPAVTNNEDNVSCGSGSNKPVPYLSSKSVPGEDNEAVPPPSRPIKPGGMSVPGPMSPKQRPRLPPKCVSPTKPVPLVRPKPSRNDDASDSNNDSSNSTPKRPLRKPNLADYVDDK